MSNVYNAYPLILMQSKQLKAAFPRVFGKSL